MQAGTTRVLKGVNFQTGTATLTTDARLTLDGVAADLAAGPAVKVEIGGHTDSRGSEPANQQLSESRARSVMAYLAAHGVDAARMTAVGYGASVPLADNSTAEGRELNRRVELKVVEGGAMTMAGTRKPVSYVDLEPKMNGKSLAPAADAPPPAPHPAPVMPAEAPKPAPAPAPTMASAPPPPPPPAAEPMPKATPAPKPAAAAAPAAGGAAKVAISNYEFSPETVTVPVGGSVTWTNMDSAAHSIKFPDEETERIRTGATYTRSFSKPGEVDYQCGIHPYMTGKVIVK
jgi:OOP family OmpA-OmpF porin